MRALTEFELTPAGQGAGATLAFSGPMTVSSLGLTDQRLRHITDPVARIDLSAVTAMDTVGAWTVWRLSDRKSVV